jgi:MOSC domain-containing protein YiiM
MMKVLSVNVGLPGTLAFQGRVATSGIVKAPVSGRVKVRKLNLEGDAQADLSVHGGPDKAVYAYPSEHYAFWKRELPGIEMPWGMFGENLTLEGLLEGEVLVGDQFRIGTAVLRVTQPRTPCYKLGMKFGREDMVDRFLASGRTGFYLSVVEEGELGKNDRLERIARGPYQVSIATVHRLCFSPQLPDAAFIRQVLQAEVLPPGWGKRFRKMLEDL